MLAVIGGSGLHGMPGLGETSQIDVDTPFGTPSAPIVRGRLGDTSVLFLARHGRGHALTPSEVNYRANIYALKALGATHVVSISAVGSLREEIVPGHVVTPTQLVDRTCGRSSTFFGGGIVAHVAMADPFCLVMEEAVAQAAQEAGATVHRGGAYVCIEGPRFSTRAESASYRAMGADVIGMTAAPEAFLAREAELPYATLALATDYDCWRPKDNIDVPAILATLRANVARAHTTIRALAATLPDPTTSAAHRALEFAIVTNPSQIPPAARARVELLAARYLASPA
jgi:5'-methylthioadenosine phosphorylase